MVGDVEVRVVYWRLIAILLCLNKKNRTSTNKKNFGHDNSTPHTNLIIMKKNKKTYKT